MEIARGPDCEMNDVYCQNSKQVRRQTVSAQVHDAAGDEAAARAVSSSVFFVAESSVVRLGVGKSLRWEVSPWKD